MAYCYVVASIKTVKGIYVQTGSAPNFQGDRITLCTCKHQMRSRLSCRDWEGKWVAGFTRRRGSNRNALVYLMRIAYAYESHCDLWNSELVAAATKRAKSARLHNLGDLYEPRPGCTNEHRFSAEWYEVPTFGHSHNLEPCPDQWHKDIEYRGTSRRPAALLVGDPEFSYLWGRRLIDIRTRIPRDYCCPTLGQFRASLQSAGH